MHFVREQDAARSDRLLAHRAVLARDHRRARRGHAHELRFRHRARRSPISTSARRRPSAMPISRSTTSSAMPRRRREQQAVLAALEFKCDVLWAHARCALSRLCAPRHMPPGRFVPEDQDAMSEPRSAIAADVAAAPAARRAARAQRGAGRLGAARARARVQGRRDRGRDPQALHRRGDASPRSSMISPRPLTRRASASCECATCTCEALLTMDRPSPHKNG